MSLPAVGRVGAAAAPRTLTLPEAAAGFGDNLESLLAPRTPLTVAGRGVQFSRHATARIESRGISLDPAELDDLAGAIDRLEKRGARESLILLGEHAFIVGVPDRKVVTVLTRHEAAGNIFTNIDSTAVVR